MIVGALFSDQRVRGGISWGPSTHTLAAGACAWRGGPRPRHFSPPATHHLHWKWGWPWLLVWILNWGGWGSSNPSELLLQAVCSRHYIGDTWVTFSSFSFPIMSARNVLSFLVCLFLNEGWKSEVITWLLKLGPKAWTYRASVFIWISVRVLTVELLWERNNVVLQPVLAEHCKLKLSASVTVFSWHSERQEIEKTYNVKTICVLIQLSVQYGYFWYKISYLPNSNHQLH